MNKKDCVLSIIITAHREGLVAHKTMKSVERAVKKIEEASIPYEVIVSIDRGDDQTIDYFNNYTGLPICTYQWDHGDLSSSRNSAIKKAHGQFVSFIDADDLMSENWLHDSVQLLLKKPYGKYVAHSAYTIEFEGADSIVQKTGCTTKDQDILLSVLSGRWNSVIIAPITLLKKFPYAPNSPGYGYEDWYLSCCLIENDVKNILIPQTAIFVRRKSSGSEWARQKASRSLLHAHPIFKPSNFRSIDINKIRVPQSEQHRQTKNTIKELIIRSRIPLGLIRRPLAIIRRGRSALLKRPAHSQTAESIPKWLKTEWKALHSIEKEIFPPSPLPSTYHTITDDHYRVGLAYWEICKELRSDSYDYALFVPWLKRGGADLFAVNYANTAASIGKKVLVISTNEVPADYSEWRSQLDKKIDFLQFGTITRFFSVDQKYRLLEQLIENTNIKTLHILNSELVYDFVRDHETYIKATNKRVIATAYSQSTDETGRIFGFSHSHIPQVYQLLDLITTDNEAVKSMWVNEYAYDPQKIVVHHQPLTKNHYPVVDKLPNSRRILWASRLAPEKLPRLVSEIADLLPEDVHIDMYGDPSPEFPASNLPSHPRVHYISGFNGVASLPAEKYDAFLYTSLFDGMPNTPVEIALRGLPIVAARVGGLPDFIGENGFIVDDITDPKSYAKCIKQTLDDIESSFHKAKNLREKASREFSEDSFIGEVKSMLSNN